jgi:ABC-type multidrug transport system fused ATPase/permease subunit
MKGRTVILVTHAVHLAARVADFIIVMKNGEVVAQGPPADVAQNPFASEVASALSSADDTSTLADTQSTYSASEETSSKDKDKAKTSDEGQEGVLSDDKDHKKLVEEEEMEQGQVKFEVYKTYYLAAGGFVFFLLFLFGFAFDNVINFGRDWWMAQFTSGNLSHGGSGSGETGTMSAATAMGFGYGATTVFGSMFNPLFQTVKMLSTPLVIFKSQTLSNVLQTFGMQDQPTREETVHFIMVYGLISVSRIFNDLLSYVFYVIINYKASFNLHEQLLRSVLGSPMRFFEVTPIGRILNRFSKDISAVDDQVLGAFSGVAHSVFKAITIIIVVSAISPMFIVGVIPLAFVYAFVTRKYLNVSRELKRLDSVTRSPIYSQFSETLSGVVVVRAFGQERRFALQSAQKADDNHRCFYLLCEYIYKNFFFCCFFFFFFFGRC